MERDEEDIGHIMMRGYYAIMRGKGPSDFYAIVHENSKTFEDSRRYRDATLIDAGIFYALSGDHFSTATRAIMAAVSGAKETRAFGEKVRQKLEADLKAALEGQK